MRSNPTAAQVIDCQQSLAVAPLGWCGKLPELFQNETMPPPGPDRIIIVSRKGMTKVGTRSGP